MAIPTVLSVGRSRGDRHARSPLTRPSSQQRPAVNGVGDRHANDRSLLSNGRRLLAGAVNAPVRAGVTVGRPSAIAARNRRRSPTPFTADRCDQTAYALPIIPARDDSESDYQLAV